jgi:hypothetical protein
MDGGRQRLRRGGYLTWEAAAAARDRLSVPVLGDPRDGVYTVVEWLETWVETRARLRDSTRRMYQSHIRLYFRRLLDGVLLRELHIGHVQDAFQRLFDEGMTAATARRLFFDAAVRAQRGRAARRGARADVGRPGLGPGRRLPHVSSSKGPTVS